MSQIQDELIFFMIKYNVTLSAFYVYYVLLRIKYWILRLANHRILFFYIYFTYVTCVFPPESVPMGLECETWLQEQCALSQLEPCTEHCSKHVCHAHGYRPAPGVCVPRMTR